MKKFAFLVAFFAFLLAVQLQAQTPASPADIETAKTDLREINEFAEERKYSVWVKPIHLVDPPPAPGERVQVAESADWRDLTGFMSQRRARNLAVWTRVAESDVPEGQVLIGLRHFHGMGVPVNEKLGVEWLRKAAEQGFGNAEYHLATCYAKGIGVDKDGEEADKWFAKVVQRLYITAEEGDVKAKVKLAELYIEGKGVFQDEAMGAIWYERAAESGNAEAQFWLAMLYRDGIGVPRNEREVERWLRMAAAQEHQDAVAALRESTARWLVEAERIAEEERRAEEQRRIEAAARAEAEARERALREARERAEAEAREREAREQAERDRVQRERDAEQKEVLWREKVVLAGATDLREEMRRRGFDPDANGVLRDFVQWGTADIRRRFQAAENTQRQATGADRDVVSRNLERIQTERVMARNEIAQMTFRVGYAYSASQVRISGNESSFQMSIEPRPRFHHRDTVLTNHWGPVINLFPVSFPMPNVAVTGIQSAYDQLHITVTGSAENIRRLADNTDQYLVRVRFQNLRDGHLNRHGTFVDILRIDIIDRVQEAIDFENITLEELQRR